MGIATRTSIINNVTQNLGLQAGADGNPPAIVAENIQPTFEVSQRGQVFIVRSDNATTTQSATQEFVTDKVKDTYLVFANLAYSKNAASDLTDIKLSIPMPDGLSPSVVRLVAQTLTAGNGNVQHTGCEILLKKNAAITLDAVFSVGASQVVVCFGLRVVE